MVQADKVEAVARPQGRGAVSLRGRPQVDAVPDEVPDAAAVAPVKRRPRRRLVIAGVLVALLAGGAWYGREWWQVGRFQVSTDDAYVGADTSVLAAKVGGHVVSVDVTSNQWVKAGDVLVRIDDGDYGLALRAAQDKIATQEAALGRFDEQIRAGQTNVDQAKAQLAAAKAELTRASVEYERQNQLARSDFASRSALDNARAARDKAQANTDAAIAAIASAQAAIAVLAAQRTEAARQLEEYRTARDRAQRDLDFTVVRAPFDGVVGNRAVQVGQLVQPGTRLAALVPLDAVYVDANFKETQLGRIQLGQKVHIVVDAYPDEDFQGTVQSISPASGSVFSLLPPENATGNFTKIVQRIPVRVALDPAATGKHELRPGMSVTAVVDTRTGGHS
ncbi:membrane fusion protein (multidrug efflux system) [Pseudochelatococcus lubricantis]|uniref:Membrane fusion protein (Multidrug efflux system) n=1 Tax=Pseudochelatococcus lubricantis TaxID=1538102 RepID=A0ABX0V2I4_9HYPH|nr:HlyD family secretion protein [Pseudochelatococcus lubricantis]NIJ58314.1 membrane fusion protein (multidrug efflux system) [Pseudochelatococcus lubricantis]